MLLLEAGDPFPGTLPSGSKSRDSCFPLGRGLATILGTGMTGGLVFDGAPSGETGSLNEACEFRCFEAVWVKFGGFFIVPSSLLSRE